MSQKVKISSLKPHGQNSYLFDDISGDAWEEFVESIKTSGVIEPIVITQDKVIVSGHQRVRACKALGIEEIDAEVRIFDSEDEILKCLIETNIRQRGIGNTNPVKFGRCIKELERIYGIQHGGDRKSEESTSNNFNLKSQDDLADELGITVQTLHNYKQLANVIPEIQDLVETGIVTPTTARAVVNKLPEFQQEELAKQLSKEDKKATKKAVDEAVAEIKKKYDADKEAAIAEIEKRIKDRDIEISDLKAKLEKSKVDESETDSESGGRMSTRERFEKQKADRLEADKKKLEEELKEVKKALEQERLKESPAQDDSEAQKELDYLKEQTLANAKMELADFVKKYSEMLDVKELLQKALEGI